MSYCFVVIFNRRILPNLHELDAGQKWSSRIGYPRIELCVILVCTSGVLFRCVGSLLRFELSSKMREACLILKNHLKDDITTLKTKEVVSGYRSPYGDETF